ncbi:Tyrosine recombinase XerC, partial [termite gut metagenome]
MCKLCVRFFTRKNMYDYANNGVTIASILDNRKEIKRGTYPIKVRVTFNRERKYYSTGKNLSVADWEKLPTSKSKVL